MKLGIISDIHGNLPALESCLELLEDLGTDRVVCLGDLVQYGPFPSEVVDLLRERGVDTIQGDCDRAVARDRKRTGDEFLNVHWEQLAAESLDWTHESLDTDQLRYLRKLPTEMRYQIGSTRILCVHGLPGNINGGFYQNTSDDICDLLLQRNSCDVLVTGHTHEPALGSRYHGIIFNPGSLGGGTLPAEATLAVLEVNEEKPVASVCWYRVPFDKDRYSSKYRSAGLPEIFLGCVLLGRDQRGKWHCDVWRQKWAEL